MSMETYEALNELLSKVDQSGDLIKLPADADVYDKSVVELDPEGNVEVFPMVGDDEELLINARSIVSGRTMLKLIGKKIPAIKKPEMLYDVDVEFCIAAIKAVTFDPTYEHKYVCTCGRENVALFNSTEFTVRSYSKDDLTSTVTLSNNQVVSMKHLPLNEFLKDPNMTATTKMVMRIESVDGIEDRVAIKQWLERLKLPLRKEIQEATSQSLGGFQIEDLEHTCECGKKNPARINLLSGFFTQVLMN